MSGELFHLFFLGLAASFGPCLFFCGPIILPLVFSYGRGVKEAALILFPFLLSRLFTFVLLSLAASAFGKLLLNFFRRYHSLIFILAAIFVILLALAMVLKKEARICPKPRTPFSGNLASAITLGIFLGLLPCAPSLGVLTYIAFRAEDIGHAGSLGLAFGLGELISPIIPVGLFYGFISPRIMGHKGWGLIRIIAAILLALIGFEIFLKGLKI